MRYFLILYISLFNFCFSNSAVEIYEKISPAIVKIIILDENNNQKGFGTGFIIKSNGVVVTNLHVVRGAHNIKVELMDGQNFFVNGFIEINEYKDIAILKFNASDLDKVSLSDSRKVKVGEGVYAIGNPLGFERTITDGIISSKEILIIQDLDGVCIPLVKDPLQREIESSYIKAVAMLNPT